MTYVCWPGALCLLTSAQGMPLICTVSLHCQDFWFGLLYAILLNPLQYDFAEKIMRLARRNLSMNAFVIPSSWAAFGKTCG